MDKSMVEQNQLQRQMCMKYIYSFIVESTKDWAHLSQLYWSSPGKQGGEEEEEEDGGRGGGERSAVALVVGAEGEHVASLKLKLFLSSVQIFCQGGGLKPFLKANCVNAHPPIVASNAPRHCRGENLVKRILRLVLYIGGFIPW